MSVQTRLINLRIKHVGERTLVLPVEQCAVFEHRVHFEYAADQALFIHIDECDVDLNMEYFTAISTYAPTLLFFWYRRPEGVYLDSEMLVRMTYETRWAWDAVQRRIVEGPDE